MSTRSGHPEVLGGAAAVRPHEAHAVAVVHHDQGPVALGDVADRAQRGDVPSIENTPSVTTSLNRAPACLASVSFASRSGMSQLR